MVPGRPEDSTQLIDVRDLADWLITAAAERVAGTYDGANRPMTPVDFMTQTAAGVGSDPEFTRVSDAFLVRKGVHPWMASDPCRMWLPRPDLAGFMARDMAPSFDAGMACRPLSDTAREMWAWLQGRKPASSPGNLARRRGRAAEKVAQRTLGFL